MAGLRGAHAGASRGARLAACRADALRALWGSPLQGLRGAFDAGLRGAFDAVADAITLLFTCARRALTFYLRAPRAFVLKMQGINKFYTK
jgi:hypothetical protein